MKHSSLVDASSWTPAELTAARIALETEIAGIEESLGAIAVELGSRAIAAIELDRDHDADFAALHNDLDPITLLINNSIEVLEQCQRALDRVTQQCYGTCEECGLPIGKARLNSMPRATLCDRCQHDHQD